MPVITQNLGGIHHQPVRPIKQPGGYHRTNMHTQEIFSTTGDCHPNEPQVIRKKPKE